MDYSLPDSSVHGIFQAIILESVAISFSMETPTQRSRTQLLNWLVDSLPLSQERRLIYNISQSCKKNETVWFSVTWVGLEIAVFTEINQTKTNTILYCLYVEFLKTVYINLFTKHKWSKECKNKFTVTRVYGEEGEIGSLGLTYTHYNI